MKLFFSTGKALVQNRFWTIELIRVVTILWALSFQSYALADSWRIATFTGQWANTRLPLLPYNLATGQLTFADSFLQSMVVSRLIATRDMEIPLVGLQFPDASIELEGTFSAHSGLQDHQEITLGIMMRSQDYRLPNGGRYNVGWSNGLSYALEPPNYEYGVGRVRGVDTVQFQYYMGLEAEYMDPRWERASVFLRLHHRSGIYGLISPSKTGSNIIGFGVRFHFDGM